MRPEQGYLKFSPFTRYSPLGAMKASWWATNKHVECSQCKFVYSLHKLYSFKLVSLNIFTSTVPPHSPRTPTCTGSKTPQGRNNWLFKVARFLSGLNCHEIILLSFLFHDQFYQLSFGCSVNRGSHSICTWSVCHLLHD